MFSTCACPDFFFFFFYDFVLRWNQKAYTHLGGEHVLSLGGEGGRELLGDVQVVVIFFSSSFPGGVPRVPITPQQVTVSLAQYCRIHTHTHLSLYLKPLSWNHKVASDSGLPTMGILSVCDSHSFLFLFQFFYFEEGVPARLHLHVYTYRTTSI